MPLTRNTYQRNSSWSAPYTFSGKEKDAETGYGYFGARYYDSGLSIWLSVDPMSDKYLSMSPYNYCANNPVILVDPDGRKVILTGSNTDEAVKQINSQTSWFFGVHLGEDGQNLEYSGIAFTRKDRLLKKMINDKNVTLEIRCSNSNIFLGRTPNDVFSNPLGGAFGYTTYNAESKTAKTIQFVCPRLLEDFDNQFNDNSFGETMLHEFAEGYAAANYVLSMPTPRSIYPEDPEYNKFYDHSHKMASKIAGGNYSFLYTTEPLPIIYRYSNTLYPTLTLDKDDKRTYNRKTNQKVRSYE